MHGWVFVWAYHGYHNNLYKHLSLNDQQHDKHKRNEERSNMPMERKRGRAMEHHNNRNWGVGQHDNG